MSLRLVYSLPALPLLAIFAFLHTSPTSAVTSDPVSVAQETQDAAMLAPAAMAPTAFTLNPPTLSCMGSGQNIIFLQVTGGAQYGAPWGFTVQWMTEADYIANGNQWLDSSDPQLCKASFSGQPNCSVYNLNAGTSAVAPGDCANNYAGSSLVINLGEALDNECGASSDNCGVDELSCGTSYVIRAFAHAGNCTQHQGAVGGGRPVQYKKSAFSPTLTCATEPCGGCVFSFGYWGTHGPATCNPSSGANLWPVGALTIGGTVYSSADLCTNLNLAPQGNKVRILTHQLIGAMLNQANGATSPPNCDITAASALLNGLNINTSTVPNNSTLAAQMLVAATCLESYNTGLGGVPHCP
jgi:hypothetical protein